MHPSLTTIADALLANSPCSKENRDHIDRLSNPQQTSMQHALFTCHQMNVKLPLKQLDEKRHELRTHFVQRRPQCANDVTAYNLLLRSHPVHSLLPSELASSMDSTEAAKRCHFCLKEFTDEMAVLRHQVQSHKLLESPSNSILQPLDIVPELSATRHCSKPAYI
ncbi:unnamed protein product [Dicrocoelium dendriticum]|nr:unnamed protein product [Dicrocoelium dendriticum]